MELLLGIFIIVLLLSIPAILKWLVVLGVLRLDNALAKREKLEQRYLSWRTIAFGEYLESRGQLGLSGPRFYRLREAFFAEFKGRFGGFPDDLWGTEEFEQRKLKFYDEFDAKHPELEV